MIRLLRSFALIALLVAGSAARADDYDDTTLLFRTSQQSASFFRSSYGYAVFPTVGEGGFVVGGAYGKGRVYQRGRYVGDTSITQLSIGAQAGGQAYSQIVFFENQAAFRKFTSGSYEFTADASAVAITASAQASAGTTGANAGTGVNKNETKTMATFRNGVAIFTVVKGGAMLQAAVAGQKFTYTPKGR